MNDSKMELDQLNIAFEEIQYAFFDIRVEYLKLINQASEEDEYSSLVSDSMKLSPFPPLTKLSPVLTLLQKLWIHEDSWPFLEPVKPDLLKIDDYFECIRNPLDFSTIIRDRIHRYSSCSKPSLQNLTDDVCLVLENALMYNARKNEIHQMALNLYYYFEEQLKSLPESIRPTLANISVSILQNIFIYFSSPSEKEQRSYYITKSICRRLGRRGGRIPRWYPNSWYRNISKFDARNSSDKLVSGWKRTKQLSRMDSFTNI